eukprot:2212849-Amphidinium_carterae.6
MVLPCWFKEYLFKSNIIVKQAITHSVNATWLSPLAWKMSAQGTDKPCLLIEAALPSACNNMWLCPSVTTKRTPAFLYCLSFGFLPIDPPHSIASRAPHTCQTRAAVCVSGATSPPRYCIVASSAISSIRPVPTRPAQLTQLQVFPNINMPMVFKDPATHTSTTAHLRFQALSQAVRQKLAEGCCAAVLFPHQ